MIRLLILFVLIMTTYVFAQEAAQPVVEAAKPVVEKGFIDMLTDGSFLAKVMAFFVALQVIFYALGEGLTRISVMTENRWDNKLASGFANVAWMMGLVISKFGYSVPKLVIEEKAEKLGEKK